MATLCVLTLKLVRFTRNHLPLLLTESTHSGPRESTTPRREPLSEEQICSVKHGGTGLDTGIVTDPTTNFFLTVYTHLGSCDLSGPKKPLRHEQRGSRECSDDVYIRLATAVTEMSSSNFTPGTSQV
jgi:hypothetical protein